MTSQLPGFFEGTGMPDPGWWEALWPDPAKVLRDVGVKPGMDVIDLCSGDGWFTLPLARIARSVVAIDIDPALVDAAKVRIAERHVCRGRCLRYCNGGARSRRSRVPGQRLPRRSGQAASFAGHP